MIKTNTGRALRVAAAPTLAVTACGDNVFGPNPTGVQFAESLEIDLDAMTETPSGLFIRDDVEGNGGVRRPRGPSYVDLHGMAGGRRTVR